MKKNKIFSKKKLFIFLILCIFSIAIFFAGTVLWLRKQKNTLQNVPEISMRSQEFIDSQKKQQGNIWSDYDPEGKKSTPFDSTQSMTTRCFIAQIPADAYSIRIDESDEKCSATATLDTPSAFLTIHLSQEPLLQSLKDETGVALRLRESSVYSLDPFFANESQNAMTFFTKDEITFFRFDAPLVLVISLYNLPKVDQEVKILMKNIIDSVVIR